MDIQPKFRKAKCDSYEGYIPYNPALMPIKKVRLSLHVIQRDNGTGNLQDTPADREFLARILNHCNGIYSEADTIKPYPNIRQQRIKDTRIRFVIDTIFYHRDSREYNFREHAGRYDPVKKDTVHDNSLGFEQGEKLYTKYVTNSAIPTKYKDSVISVFLVEGGTWANTGMTYNLYSKRWIYLLGSWHLYKFDINAPNHWGNGLTLAHELGHALGMNHVFEGHECKDVPLTPKGSTNNFMDTWPHYSNGMSACQVGSMQMGLEGKKGDISDALVRDWCSWHSKEKISIPKGDTVYFEGDRKLTGDIEIMPGGILIIKCRLSMPPGGTISIRPGGTLIIDGGSIYNTCGMKWNGIEMEKRKPFLFFKRKTRSHFQVFNDGSFLNSENGIMKVEMQP
jgi:hypothetical protein